MKPSVLLRGLLCAVALIFGLTIEAEEDVTLGESCEVVSWSPFMIVVEAANDYIAIHTDFPYSPQLEVMRVCLEAKALGFVWDEDPDVSTAEPAVSFEAYGELRDDTEYLMARFNVDTIKQAISDQGYQGDLELTIYIEADEEALCTSTFEACVFYNPKLDPRP